MRTLAMDTSTMSMSLALMEDQKMKAQVTTNTKIKHSTQVLPLLNTLFDAVKWQPDQLDQVVVVRGPGSYTGLRIGATTAKTLAWTLGLSLYSVSSLQALAWNVLPAEEMVFTLINARRKTLFGAGFTSQGDRLLEDQYFRLDEYIAAVKDLAGNQPVCFVSPDMAIFQEDLAQAFGDQARIELGENQIIHASRLLQTPMRREDVHTFLPEYGKLAEAEEKWQASHPDADRKDGGQYVERAD